MNELPDNMSEFERDVRRLLRLREYIRLQMTELKGLIDKLKKLKNGKNERTDNAGA